MAMVIWINHRAYVRGSGDVKNNPKQANRSIQTVLLAAQSGYALWFGMTLGLLFPVMIYGVLCYELQKHFVDHLDTLNYNR